MPALSRSLLCQRFPFSTNFSGTGSVEIAAAMLTVSGRSVLSKGLQLLPVSACEKKSALHDALVQRLGGGCVFQAILERVRLGALQYGCDGELTVRAARDAVLAAEVLPGAPCQTHGSTCKAPPVQGDVSGTPCTLWSAAGKRRGKSDPRVVLLLSWCALLRATLPKIAIHENVVSFDTSFLAELLGDVYQLTLQRVRSVLCSTSGHAAPCRTCSWVFSGRFGGGGAGVGEPYPGKERVGAACPW